MDQGHAPRETTAERLYREAMGEDAYERQVKAYLAEHACTCGPDRRGIYHTVGCPKNPEKSLKRRTGTKGRP